MRDDGSMLLAELVAVSAAVGATRSRTAKVQAVAGALRGTDPGEAPAVVAFLSGELRQRQIGVGWSSLKQVPEPAAVASLTVAEVDDAFGRIGALAGPGSQAARRDALGALFTRATADEQAFLRRLLLGDLGQGALEGIVVTAVATAADMPVDAVRRAHMLHGDLGDVARIALAEGAEGLGRVGLEVGRPIHPMLAQPADSLQDALGRISPAAVETKLDGVRIQVHRSGADVALFTRTLDDVTARLPELVEAALALPARELVLDGEAIALRPDGRPHPFQVTASRLGSRTAVERLRAELPLTPQHFDVLHVDGEDLLDRPGSERAEVLDRLVPTGQRAARIVAAALEPAQAAFAAALAAGHEGVVVKDLSAPYAAGRRGGGWLKVKPRHTLDLVVLAVEWGHGRRSGLLSNLHLGARGPDGAFVMLGKTFKGLTDKMLAWQTERLQELAVSTDGHVVRVRPELVVEIAFDGVQSSPRYPGGVALRFARVLQYRPDKPAREASTLEEVLAIHSRGS
ncbi:MAG: ligase 1 [Solirubrobacteraceae bacterium]|nr:ligase 1 [Solirubrobacteraceae bacterium]